MRRRREPSLAEIALNLAADSTTSVNEPPGDVVRRAGLFLAFLKANGGR